MPEMTSQVHVNGPVSGQIAVGNYINQFQNLNGCTISIHSPDQRPLWERHDRPPSARPRPPGLFLDRTTEVQIVEISIQALQPIHLSGITGIGKSSLLKQITHLVRPGQFTDGLFYLSGYNLKLEDLLQCLFSGFYRSNIPVKPDRAQLQEALQDIKALVVIDDLALNSDELQVVLDMAPGCMFVAASSMQMLQNGYKTLRLGGLPDDDAVTLFESELERPLEEQERQTVCELNEMLKGHPESLRWLSATMREDRLSIEQVREKLKELSIQGFFQESTQSLPDRQKKILAILTTVEGLPLPLEHLATMLPDEPVQPALNDLAARGLIQTQNQAAGIKESFSMTLSRTWKLAEWEQFATRHFVDWLGRQPAPDAVKQVRDPLWVLLKKAARRRDWTAVVRLGRALEPFFIVSGYWQAWAEILQLILEAARGLADRKLEGWALHQLGSRSLCLESNEQAVDLLQQAESIRRSIGDHAGLQLTQQNLSLASGLVPATGAAAAAGTASAGSTSLLSIAIGIALFLSAGATITAGALFYTPRPPTPLRPADHFIQTSGQSPSFEWRKALAASTYQIQVDDQPDFSSPLFEQTLSGTGHAPDLTLEQGIYYWRIRAARGSNRTGKWSTTQQFTISIPPGPTSLLQPPDGSVETKPGSLVFRWAEAENATSYRIQIDNDNDFSSPAHEATVDRTEYPAPGTLQQGTYSWRVRAANEFDTPGDWSGAATFAVSLPPAALHLLEPAHGTKLENTTTPVFKWEPVDNASEYEIEVDDHANFSSPQYSTRLPDTSFAVPDSLPQGSYSWHVRAINPLGTPGEWSNPWEFIISIPPGIPPLVNPENGTLAETSVTPTFAWQAVENAARYEIQVDDSQSFNSVDYESQTANTDIQPPDALDQGSYYWRVRALNPYDTAGDWSPAWIVTVSIPPEAPELAAPSRQSVFISNDRPNFTWQGVPNAEEYQIQVGNSETFNTPVYADTTSRTRHPAPGSLGQGEYYWRVRGANRYGTYGQWSETWQFIISIPPGVPALASPAQSDLVIGPSAGFSWNQASNAAYYELQVNNSSSFNSPVYDKMVTGTNQTLMSGLPQGSIHWRVRAFNRYDTAGDWSATQQFTLSIPPDAPRLATPKTGSQVTAGSSSFGWRETANAAQYRLQIDTQANFSSPYETSTSGTGITIKQQFPTGKYYWRVQAINSYGTAGIWSKTWDFTIPLPAPVLVAPPNSRAAYTQTPPTFDWRGVANAGRYQIQIDNNRDFSSPVASQRVRATQVTISGLDTKGPVCEGSADYPYYWRVRALDSSDNPGQWSSTWFVLLRFRYVC